MQTTYLSHRVRAMASVVLSALVFGACATPPVAPPNPVEVARAEIALGVELAQRLESKLQLAADPEVTIYLRALAERLLRVTPGGGDAAVGVLVSRDRDGVWRNFSLPGNRIYLSLGFLKSVEYEHEVAAALAIELAHVSGKHLLDRVRERVLTTERSDSSVKPGQVLTLSEEDLRALDFFSPAGVFTFPESAHLSAVETAFSTLYQAGFDPRGLASVISIYQKNKTRSPYEDNMAEKLLNASRQVIARTAPLRNPIMRSQEFLKFKKRIQRL